MKAEEESASGFSFLATDSVNNQEVVDHGGDDSAVSSGFSFLTDAPADSQPSTETNSGFDFLGSSANNAAKSSSDDLLVCAMFASHINCGRRVCTTLHRNLCPQN